MEGTAKPPPAGWYVDPDDGALQRFWDGTRWTSHRMPLSAAVLAEDAPPELVAPAAPPATLAQDPAASEPGGVAAGPRAGWYADPENSQGMRYWDGARWTADRTDYLPAPAGERPSSDALVAAGYIFALLIPIIGLVIGSILLGRKDRHGPWILGLALFFIALFVALSYLGDSSS
jgi:Protein of unknown function (DUF2510)